MENCLFCKIIKGEIPSYKVYEDEKTFAFLDIDPSARGHCLVIPKKHAKDMFDVKKEDLEAVILTVRKLAKSLKINLSANGINVLQANQEAAGQSVFHIHFHIIPRYHNDGIHLFPEAKYKKKDFEKTLNQIKGL